MGVALATMLIYEIGSCFPHNVAATGSRANQA
jgi:hypothetical protein